MTLPDLVDDPELLEALTPSFDLDEDVKPLSSREVHEILERGV